MITKYKAGDLAYWIQEVNSDTDSPQVVSMAIKQASDRQITLKQIGPQGCKTFGVTTNGEPTRGKYGPTPAFHSSAQLALIAYQKRQTIIVDNAWRDYVRAKKRLMWAFEQVTESIK